MKCLDPTYFGPCRKCKACLENRQRQWLLRMILEGMLYDEDRVIFLTLTYSDTKLPSDVDQAKRQMQLFMKRLRKAFGDRKIRYVAALERGSQHGRYHWHAVFYGIRFSMSNRAVIESCWSNGFIDMKLATHGSMHYVLKYIIKGHKFLMSRRPGIGAGMIKSINELLQKLSKEEVAKLRGSYFTLHYPNEKKSLARLRVGKYDYPIHRYLKDRCLVPPANNTYLEDASRRLNSEFEFSDFNDEEK
jgi:hypothetical protein